MVLEEGYEEQCDQSGCQNDKSNVRHQLESGSDEDLFIEQDNRDLDQDDGKYQEELRAKQNLRRTISRGPSKRKDRASPSKREL